MIHIDFQGGTHGNFLEFACNLAAGVKALGDPFNTHGASHQKKYIDTPMFFANHYSFQKIPLIYNKVIAVKITTDDLLPLSQISLLRAGDYGYDNNQLEVDTYNKLNNINYRWVLDTLLESFFTGQIKRSFDAVKDETWPTIHSLEDFNNLPEHIRNECINVHNLELLQFTEQYPDCPRHILREFFQLGFENPEMSGFIVQQSKMCYNTDVEVYNFPFSAFYNTSEFLNQVLLISKWAGYKVNDIDNIARLHNKFLDKQPYKDSKIKCDLLVKKIINETSSLPTVTLMEEAYINAKLKEVGCERRY